jgi:hypothetical protein
MELSLYVMWNWTRSWNGERPGDFSTLPFCIITNLAPSLSGSITGIWDNRSHIPAFGPLPGYGIRDILRTDGRKCV